MADSDLLDMHSIQRTGRQLREYIEECKHIIHMEKLSRDINYSYRR